MATMQIKTTENSIQRKQTSCCVVMVRKIKCLHSSAADNSGLLGCDVVSLRKFSDILACLTLNTKALQSFKMLETTRPTTCHITDNLNPSVLLRVHVTYRYEVFMVLFSSGLWHHAPWKVNINILMENIVPLFRNLKTEKLHYSSGGT